MSCGGCKGKIDRSTTGASNAAGLKIATCSGPCNQLFHQKCAGLAVDADRMAFTAFCCQVCTIDAMMRNHMKDLTQQVKDLREKVDCVLELQSKVSALEEEVGLLKAESQAKDKQLSELTVRVCHQEQYSRRAMLEIRELHEVPDEDLKGIVVKMASKFGVNISTNEIQVAHRLRARDGKVPGVIVKLASCEKRDAIVFAKQRVITNTELVGSGDGRIFYGESLSPYYKHLLHKVKIRAKQADYKQAWYYKNAIHVRKAAGDREVIRITCEDEISKIKLPPPAGVIFNRP